MFQSLIGGLPLFLTSNMPSQLASLRLSLRNSLIPLCIISTRHGRMAHYQRKLTKRPKVQTRRNWNRIHESGPTLRENLQRSPLR